MNHNIPKQETVIYGGMFDPPTRAHQGIFQSCIDYAEPRGADVWLMPSGTRIDKENTVSRDRRIAYVQAMVAGVLNRTVAVGIETMELDRTRNTETIETVREMNARYPERSFTWVFGSDSVATMPTWGGGEWMMDNLSMLIVERPNYPIVELGKNAMRLQVATMTTSSTQVRERLQHNQPVGDLVIPEVERLLVPTMR